MPKTPASSPLSKRERLALGEAILSQQKRGELTPEQAQAALAKLDSPPVLRG